MTAHSHRNDAIQEDLFKLLTEVLEWMTSKSLQDGKVWEVALNCTLFFICHVGRILKNKLQMIPAVVIVAFLENCDRVCKETHRKLVQMLLNRIYNDQKQLNTQQLKECGGVEVLVGLYARTTHVEARDNLFVAIFDSVLDTAKLSPSDPQVQALLEALFRAGAAYHFTQLFWYAPKNFVAGVMAGLGVMEGGPLASRVKPQIAETIITGFWQIASKSQQLDPEQEKSCTAILAGDTSDTTLSTLVEKETPEALKTIELLLHRAMIAAVDAPEGKRQQWTALDAAAAQVLTLRNPLARRAFLYATQRTLQYLKSKFQQYGDVLPLSAMFHLLNHNMLLVIPVETAEPNVLLMLTIIFNLITIKSGATEQSTPLAPRPRQPSGAHPSSLLVSAGTADAISATATPGAATTVSTTALQSQQCQKAGVEVDGCLYAKFLRGQISASIPLLFKINIKIMAHIVSCLPNTHGGEARAVAVKLLCHCCKKKTDKAKTPMEQAGGELYFLKLVWDLNPLVAFYASQYLLEVKQQDQPEIFKRFVNRVLQKAYDVKYAQGQTLDMSNHYFVFMAFYDMILQELGV
eukprot:TRINITY_DN17937_c0_g1_i1.p1 TRINITY_DN17937_c0_g1~~TRINITY_DN17937_c0_g1_i1.p1  ORF type:complete len:577 (-),score=174.17 TRINITY_DN17937_c0_g1_i1:33-1763(-)